MQESQVETVISLLATTDMTIPEIAQRMGCSPKTIAGINQRFRVRHYNGRRSSWVVSLSVREKQEGADNLEKSKPFWAHLF